jgi:aryl-alcohol dehydrogenase-like predicted oxidoreductase
MKIAVGTAQFGMPYGIANQGGQTPRDAAAEILAVARAAGATLLDTAIDYGEAETVLGEIGASKTGWRIITKLPGLPAGLPPEEVGKWCQTTVEGSLRLLGADHLEGLLLHRPDDLRGPSGPALASALIDVRDRGLTAATGISIYDP